VRCGVWLLFIATWAPLLLPAQEISARATVDSSSYSIGDPVTVRLRFSHGGGISFNPLFGDTLGSFLVLSRPALTPSGENETVGSFVVSRYDSGTAVIPPAEFSYLDADSSLKTVSTGPLTVRFALVEVDTSGPIRDLRPPISIPMTLAEIALFAGIALILVAASYLVYRFLKKRKERAGMPADTPAEIRPPHVIALEELGTLREKHLWQRGLSKQYYSELTDILRRYFEARFGLRAPEETTEEIMRGIDVHIKERDVREIVRSLLIDADLVKFARFVPGTEHHERSMAAAVGVVDRTRLATQPAEDSAPGEEVHAGA